MIAASHASSRRRRPAAPDDDRREQLRSRCMTELSRLDRLIIVLYYYEQLTAREVGAILELPEDQVETRRLCLARRLAALCGT